MRTAVTPGDSSGHVNIRVVSIVAISLWPAAMRAVAAVIPVHDTGLLSYFGSLRDDHGMTDVGTIRHAPVGRARVALVAGPIFRIVLGLPVRVLGHRTRVNRSARQGIAESTVRMNGMLSPVSLVVDDGDWARGEEQTGRPHLVVLLNVGAMHDQEISMPKR